MNGPLTLEMTTPRDLLAKARRERDRLQRALGDQDKVQAGDALFNFAVTAFHVKDWIKHAAPDQPASKKVERFVNDTPVLEGCRAVCHSGKHFKLCDLAPDVTEVRASATAVMAGAGVDPAEAAPEAYRASFTGSVKMVPVAPWRLKVIFANGARMEALEFADRVLDTWGAFLARHRR